MIAGMVCLLRTFGVFVCFSVSEDRREEIRRPDSEEVRLSEVVGKVVDDSPCVEGCERDSCSSNDARAFSSHFPRTTSTLFVIRCVDVHLLGATDEAEDPVVFVSRLKDDDCELVRDNE